MIIKQVNEGLIDVFCGNGWDNWTRFSLTTHKGRVQVQKVKGRSLAADEFKKLLTGVNTK